MARGDDPLYVWQLKDGRWRGQVTDGYLPSGSPRRRYVHGRTEKEARTAKKQLLREIASGQASTSGRTTVRAWAETWLTMQERTQRPRSYLAYRNAIRNYAVPAIGKRRLGDLSPADIRAVTDRVRRAGRSSTTAQLVQSAVTTMLKDAVAEGHPVPARALTVTKPRRAVNDRTAMPLDDALAVLKVAAGDPDGSQWAAAFLQGMRQGERLGLTWPCVDLDAGTIDVSWQLQTLRYRHGCDPTCGRKTAARCPARQLVTPDGYDYRQLHGVQCLVRPKSARGWRVIPLVPWMSAALTAWRERAPRSPHGLVWPRPDGQPWLVRDDVAAWHSLQDRAQVAHVDGILGRRWHGHEIRHTTATLLMSLGVDETVRTAILGHSSILTTRGYQHANRPLVLAALEAAAGRLGLVG